MSVVPSPSNLFMGENLTGNIQMDAYFASDIAVHRRGLSLTKFCRFIRPQNSRGLQLLVTSLA